MGTVCLSSLIILGKIMWRLHAGIEYGNMKIYIQRKLYCFYIICLRLFFESLSVFCKECSFFESLNVVKGVASFVLQSFSTLISIYQLISKEMWYGTQANLSLGFCILHSTVTLNYQLVLQALSYFCHKLLVNLMVNMFYIFYNMLDFCQETWSLCLVKSRSRWTRSLVDRRFMIKEQSKLKCMHFTGFWLFTDKIVNAISSCFYHPAAS